MANAYLVVRIKGQADCPYWATHTMTLLKLDKKVVLLASKYMNIIILLFSLFR